MEILPNGLKRIDRVGDGYDYSAVDKVVEAIVEDLSPMMIIIFGSVAKGTADGESDMDILVVMESDKKYLKRSVDVQMSFWKRNMVIDADVIVVTPEEFEENKDNEHSFISEIVSTGVVAYEA